MTVDEIIPGTEQYNLLRRFRRMERQEKTDWVDSDAFLAWAQNSGYFKGAYLLKLDHRKRYGPGNAYWSETFASSPRGPVAEIVNESPFCQNCGIQLPERCGGCDEYRKWYAQNWDNNIHQDLNAWIAANQPKVEEPETREKFQYEHPDRMRELRAQAEMAQPETGGENAYL